MSAKRKKEIRAIILLSGGLDSTLACYLAKEQGLELIALNFTSVFCLCNKKGGCCGGIRSLAGQLGFNLVTLDNSQEMINCVKKPAHGYGSHMNPCIDCRIIMLKKAKDYMQESEASFIITGEVLGQRPMSQKRHQLRLIEKEAGLEGLILRPLSAQVLGETLPEKEGWVDRNKLLGIAGRGRKEQIALIKKFGMNDYPCPAGGCLLTDPNFSCRLKDLMRYNPHFTLPDVILLKLGRHFRINERCKLIVGRNEQENKALLDLSTEPDTIFMPEEEVAGPTALGRGVFSTAEKEIACQIASHYCDKLTDETVKIYSGSKAMLQKECFLASALSEARLSALKI